MDRLIILDTKYNIAPDLVRKRRWNFLSNILEDPCNRCQTYRTSDDLSVFAVLNNPTGGAFDLNLIQSYKAAMAHTNTDQYALS